jgi:hypothetical protein
MLITILFTWTAMAQGADPKSPEMRKLDFLVGEWKGEAWIQMGPGKREHVIQSEKVTPRLGGKILLVEGLGRKKNEDGSAGDVVHDALAVISFDPEAKELIFDAHVAAQDSVEARLEVRDDKSAVWGFDVPNGGKVRYTIRLTDKGEWNEVGEYSRDGANWMKFMEMTLLRVK